MWFSMVGSVFFNTLFAISSGPGALFGASLLIALCICLSVISVSHGTSCGYVVAGMSERSALGGFGKKVFWSTSTFYSFVTASSFSVGTNADVGVLAMYFWTCQMVFSSALSTNSFHLLSLACAISYVYSFALFLHAVLSVLSHVRLCLFRNRFASLLSLVSLLLHHRLLCGHGFLRGVVSSTAFLIASTF